MLKRIAGLFLIGIVFIVAMTITGCDTLKATEYVNEEQGFSIVFPKGWSSGKRLQNPTLVVDAIKLDTKNLVVPEMIAILVDSAPAKIEYGELFSRLLKSVKASSRYNVHDKGETVFNNKKVKWVLYSENTPEAKKKQIMYLLLKGQKVISIYFSAAPDTLDAHRATYEEIMNTFKFTK